MAEPFAERVRGWRRVLAPCPDLSERFRTRYAVMLAGLERQAPDAMGREVRVLASRNPGSAARALLGRPEPSVLANDVDVRVTGSPQVASWLRRVLDGRDVTAFFATQQPLRQTAVPLHPSRRARLIEAGDVSPPLVAVVWPASSLSARGRCMDAVRELVEHANGRGGACRFRVLDEYALVWPSGDGDPWAVAENLGLTLDDELRFGRLQPEPRQRIVDGLRRLRGAMVETGKVWQGFAPRNMFWRDGEIVLIDFEEVVDAGENPVGAAERWYWHRVFFADCLEPKEYEALFAMDGHDPRVEDDEKLPADAFERALLGVEKVDWRQRRALLAQSVALEGRHQRPDVRRDGGQLFGHELGHFWGDFVPPAEEARIFRALTAPVDERIRVACLEAFEAAMEADIVRMLRQEAMGAKEVDVTAHWR